jgi:Capsule assembly protein Wzi
MRFRYLFYSSCVILAVVTLVISANAIASTYIPVGDRIYDLLYRLEAEGVIESGLLTTQPLSRKEAVRLLLEAERNSGNSSTFIQSLVASLKYELRNDIDNARFIKPLDFLYGKYLYADSDIQKLYYNIDGDNYDKGSNLRFGFDSRAELDWFSLYINPELRYSEDGTALVMKRGYGVLSFLGLDLQIGKDSQWWGPGYHGALLLTNNAEPFTMVRLTNPQPVLLPWVLKYLGPFNFTFFATRLEKDRKDVPEPYLWGMRLNFKPHPYFEFGLTRTALLGGEGRSEDLKTWWYSFTGQGENIKGVEAGDQRAGFDLKLTLPFRLQPLQLYAEAAGEDEAGGLPTKWAYVTGIYLPRLLSLERIAFRAEYATDHVTGHPNIWYNHHIYTAGYTYEGRIIGHHMGTDSRDIFLETSYLIPEKNGKLSLFYDREEHNLSRRTREKKDEVGLTADLEIMKGLELEAAYRHGSFRNFNNVAGEDRDINILTGMIRVSEGLALGDSFSKHLPNIKNDYENFYLSGDNLLRLGIGIGCAGLFANTSMDSDIQEFYQDNIRSDVTDDLSKIFKIPGNIFITPPVLLGTYLLFKDSSAGEWAQKSLRALAVGAPAGLLLQRVTGASRPSEGDSKWRPFNDANGLSGHAFIGAIPFITAAKMNENPYVKGLLYGLSFLPGLSRINDNEHYFSQTALGWYLALLSCNSVEKTDMKKDTKFAVIPLSDKGLMVTINRNF